MAPGVQRFGLTELYRPDDGTGCKVDIFFVHGLFGHPKETWTCHVKPDTADDASAATVSTKKRWGFDRSDLQEVFWPRDLLPGVMSTARIFTWGYDVQINNLFASASKATVFQHAETLLLDVYSVRTGPTERERPIIFVAHSLGGIVVKEALCVSRMESSFLKEILPATAGVCFLGTPHKGTKLASIGKIVFGLSRTLALQDPNMKILRSLEAHSDVLERIGRSFMQVLGEGKLKVHSFREELKTKGVMIVDAVAATLDHFAETRSSIHADHQDLVRFRSAEDPGFTRVTAILLNWTQVDQLEVAIIETDGLEVEGFGSTGYSAYRQQLSKLDEADLIRDFLTSLDRTEARERIKNVEDRFEDTYEWLFEDRVAFVDWLQNKIDSTLFWISGKPGSGKSTMMKLALRDQRTPEHLSEYHNSPWVVAGFFFHDRGTAVQKSLEGLFREILFQILQQHPQFIRALLEAPHAWSLIFTEKNNNLSFSVEWTTKDLEMALLSLVSNYGLSVCLFIDALDEHEGNHQALINFVQKLARVPETCHGHLKVCLASRPENLFRQRFGSAPGFAIHDHTRDDIRKYAQAGMTDIAAEAIEGFQSLLGEVLEKANGVFLWIKLAIAELVADWLSGDTVDELRRTLSEIPEELQDLYRRALQRNRLHNSRSVARDRLETYIMFQIAQYNPPKLSVSKFTKLIQYNILGDKFKDNQFTDSQMRRRINDRSSGLLEFLVDDRERTSVQFIHQTTREYFVSGLGYKHLYEDTVDQPVETGLTYFVRATLWLRALDRSFYAPELMVIESKSSLPAVWQCDDGYINTYLGSEKINWPMPDALFHSARNLASKDILLARVIIAVLFSLDISRAKLLSTMQPLPEDYGALLLRIAVAVLIMKSQSKSPSETHGARRCLTELIQAGASPNDAFLGSTCLQDLVASDISDPDFIESLDWLGIQPKLIGTSTARLTQFANRRNAIGPKNEFVLQLIDASGSKEA